MPAHTHAPTTRAVDTAITRVLGAERAARDEVQRSADEAEQLRQAARATARGIAERAARRVADVHSRVATALLARIDELELQRRALHDQPTAATNEAARVDRALDKLAAELSEDRE
jgi:outer membrane murein-binding lipoprotein Lpp